MIDLAKLWIKERTDKDKEYIRKHIQDNKCTLQDPYIISYSVKEDKCLRYV